MKILTKRLAVLVLVLFSNCTELPKSVELTNQVEIYRSTENSFQKDFYLKIENDLVSVFGWEFTSENDTVYYKSISKLEEANVGVISFKLENHELTKTKTTEWNLNNFIGEKGLKDTSSFYSSFFGKKSSKDLIELQAVKHIYYSRADEFKFEKIE